MLRAPHFLSAVFCLRCQPAGARLILAGFTGLILASGTGIGTGPAWADRSLPKPEFLPLVSQARGLMQQGQWDKAEPLLRKAIGLFPDDPLNVIQLASVLTQQGNYHEAMSLYQRAMLLDASDPMIPYSLGALQELSGDLSPALQSYQNALNRSSEYAYTHLAIARVALPLGQTSLAEKHLQDFLAVYPNDYDGNRFMASVALQQGEGMRAAQLLDKVRLNYPERFAEHVNLAKALSMINEPDKALLLLNSMPDESRRRADVFREMGRAHELLNNTPLALDAYQNAYQLNPAQTELMLKQGALLQEMGQVPESITQIENFLSQKQSNPQAQIPDALALEAQHRLGELYLKKTPNHTPEPEKALAVFAAVEAHLTQPSPDIQQAYTPQQRQSLLSEIQRSQALAYQLSGNLPEAIARYENILRNTPSGKTPDVQLLNNLAIAYHQNNELDKAIPAYRRVYQQLAGNPSAQISSQDGVAVDAVKADYYRALMTIAKSGEQSQDIETGFPIALSVYREAAALYPERLEPVLAEASLLTAVQHYPEALEIYDTILQKHPTQKDAIIGMAQLQLDWKHDPNAARIQLEPLAKVLPGDTEVAALLMETYLALNRYQEAQTLLETYHQAAPKAKPQPRLLNLQAILAERQGNLEQSVALYQQAIQLAPQEPAYLYGLARIYTLQGKLAPAKTQYEAVLKLKPDHSGAVFGLGGVYLKQQHWANALSAYERFQTLRQQEQPQAFREDTLWQSAQEQITWLNQKLNRPQQATQPHQQAPGLTLPGQSSTSPAVFSPQSPQGTVEEVELRPYAQVVH